MTDFNGFEERDPGHVYALPEYGEQGFVGTHQTLAFIKRSGGQTQYDEEWDGTNSQSVIRALVARTDYLNNEAGPMCVETANAERALQEAYYWYEVRAWRRKQDKVNRKSPEHDDTERNRAWREFPDGVPFTVETVMDLPLGEDGHVIPRQSET